MEAIVSAEQDAQTSEICKTELVLLLWLATADVRCTAYGYPGAVRDDSLLSCTADWLSSFTCENKCAHKYFFYIIAIDD